MHYFHTVPPSYTQFYPWDIKCFLLMLQSLAPASSLTNFKLPWIVATLVALVATKHSDLSLLCIDNQNCFLQHCASIFIPASGSKTDWLGNCLPQIPDKFQSSVIICPVFYLKTSLHHTEPFRKG